MRESFSDAEIDRTWMALYEQKDKPIKLSRQIAMLREAGFRAVDVIHKQSNFSLTAAYKN
jgi:hypothetical protein